MVKLSWQFGAWAFALYSTYLWATADPTTPHLMRDGLFVAAVALLIILWQSNRFLLTRTRPLVEHLTIGGQIVLWTGLICALVGSLLAGQPWTGPTTAFLSGTVLWWIGGALLVCAIVWPRAWRNTRHPSLRIDGAADNAADHVTREDSPALDSVPPRLSMPKPLTRAHSIPGVNWLSLLLILLIGSGIHWLVMSRLPAFCVGAACEAALAVNDGTAATSFPLIIAQWLNGWLNQELLSIRVTVSLLTLLGITGFYLSARRLVSGGGALLGTLLLVMTPWVHTLDAGSLPALTLFFWSTVALWLLLTAWQRQQPRWALLAGIALGFATQLPLFQVGLLLWLLLLIGLTLLLANRDGTHLLTGGLTLLGFLVSALPTWLQQGGLATLEQATLGVLPFSGTEVMVALFQPGLLALTEWANPQWVGVPPFTILLGGATIAGTGYLLRSSREPLAGWLLSGWIISALLFLYTGNSESFVESTTLFVLLSTCVATVALHALLTTFSRNWQRLVPVANTVAVAALLLLLVSLSPLRNLLEESGQNRAAGQSLAEQAMLTQIGELLAVTPDLTIFAPASLSTNPVARLRLGEAAPAQIQPLSSALNALYTSEAPGDTAYFVPFNAQPYNELIQRIQPGATSEQQFDPQTGEPLYTQWRSSAATQVAQQGLLGVAWERNSDGSSTSHVLPTFGPLAFDPGILPALRPPFSLQWTGGLRVPAPGTYRFSLDLPADALPDTNEGQETSDRQNNSNGPRTTISLQLDNRLILDSVLGLTEQELVLAKGFYQLSLFVHHPGAAAGATGDTSADTDNGTNNNPVPPTSFTVRWQRPDGREEVVPQHVLYKLPLPNVGLIGEYYADGAMTGTPFDIRKDLVVGLVGARQEPYAVRWRGQLAAPRTGEYLLAALGAPAGITRLSLNGTQLFDTALDMTTSTEESAPDSSGANLSSYAEGTIYLERGWHEIVVEYQPDATAPTVQFFWQPPGSGPTPLDATYLAPVLTPLTNADRELPPAPPLAPDVAATAGANGGAGGNGVSSFALSYGTDYWDPQVQVPPTALPALPFEAIWQVGSCGSGSGQLAQPHGVALSAIRRLLYVADTANQRVIEYNLDGTVNRIYTYAEWQEPVDVALIDEGFPVVLDAARQSLTNLKPATGGVEQRPVGTGFYFPRGLAVDGAGNLLIADTGGGRVARLMPNGELVQSLGGPETPLGRGQPTDVVEAGGTLWAVTAEDGRLRQPVQGGSLAAIARTNTINGPHLAGLPNGTLFLSDPARRTVLYLAATGEPRATVNLPGLLEPTGIAAAAIDDLLYLAVVDTAGCRLSLWRTDPTQLLLP